MEVLPFAAVCCPVVTAIIIIGIVLTVREKKRVQGLREYAADRGWRPVAGSAPLPSPVTAAAGSPHAQFTLERDHPRMWVSWHSWQETSSNSDGSSSTWYHQLTRYFTELAGGFPDCEVSRRTRLGAWVVPRRGLGTDDDAFDRAFVISPKNNVAVRELFPRVMRQALLQGSVPPWSIRTNVLMTSYDDAPTIENLEQRAQDLVRLASLLPRY